VIRLHDTRHKCATLLATLGVSPRTIMAFLGHSQIAVTMNVYTHVTTEEQRQAVALLDRLLTAADGSSAGVQPSAEPSKGPKRQSGKLPRWRTS
jgi:Phage integrase family